VLNDRFGNELKYEIALHLATLSILHDYVNFGDSVSAARLIKSSLSPNESGASSEDTDDEKEDDADEEEKDLKRSTTASLINFKDIKYFITS
jgi:hypothetical protein